MSDELQKAYGVVFVPLFAAASAEPAAAGLDATETAVCRAMGLEPSAYVATRAKVSLAQAEGKR